MASAASREPSASAQKLAASWKCGKRHITVVGVGDIRELWELVA